MRWDDTIETCGRHSSQLIFAYIRWWCIQLSTTKALRLTCGCSLSIQPIYLIWEAAPRMPIWLYVCDIEVVNDGWYSKYGGKRLCIYVHWLARG